MFVCICFPEEVSFDEGESKPLDAIVNLAGENIGDGDASWGPLRHIGRWTDAKKAAVVQSRVASTRALVNCIAALQTKVSNSEIDALRTMVVRSSNGTEER